MVPIKRWLLTPSEKDAVRRVFHNLSFCESRA
jgi:hypothetical protein